jgi:hypothetical protein
MEDYYAAFLQRTTDVTILDESGRRTAAIHFGGVAIECLLKHLIFASLPDDAIKEWKTNENDPGHTITNPGHDYDEALRRHNLLRSSVRQHPSALAWLNDVEKPAGHFIDMRYVGNEPSDEKYKRWKRSYRSLVGWLEKQAPKNKKEEKQVSKNDEEEK